MPARHGSEYSTGVPLNGRYVVGWRPNFKALQQAYAASIGSSESTGMPLWVSDVVCACSQLTVLQDFESVYASCAWMQQRLVSAS